MKKRYPVHDWRWHEAQMHDGERERLAAHRKARQRVDLFDSLAPNLKRIAKERGLRKALLERDTGW